MATTTRAKANQIAKRIAKTCHFDLIPDEIIIHHIFKYYRFTYWLKLSLVNKKWKRISESAKVAKELWVLEGTRYGYTIAHSVNVVHKYQPNTLLVDFDNIRSVAFGFNMLALATQRLDTIIIKGLSCNKIASFRPIECVTTLALIYSKGVDRQIDQFFQLFPNLQRLQIDFDPARLQLKEYKSLKSLAVLTRYSIARSMEEFSFIPEIIVACSTHTTVQLNNTYIDPKDLSYEQYYRYFGKTKLQSALAAHNFVKAAQLLETETSMKYEEMLRTDLNYKFPTKELPNKTFSLDSFTCPMYETFDVLSQEAYDTLVRTKKLPVSNENIFISLVSYNRMKEALELISNVPNTISVVQSLYQMLLSKEITTEMLKKHLSVVQSYIIPSIGSSLVHVDQWNKIRSLFIGYDWTNYEACTDSEELFFSMVQSGCKIPYKSVVSNTKLMEELLKRDPSQKNIFFLAANTEYSDQLELFMKKYNLDFTTEYEGASLCSQWVRHCTSIDPEKYKSAVNHVDSSGNTALTSCIKYRFERGNVKLEALLEMGADPNLPRGNKLSPLGTALVRIKGDHNILESGIELISALVTYGADINAPCLYEQRMCSPLMIAVQLKLRSKILLFMIGIGARTDYADETGRTILECAKECDDSVRTVLKFNPQIM